MKRSVLYLTALLLLNGCGPKDLTNAVVMTLGKRSSNNLSLVGYGYDAKNRYLNQDVGKLHLTRAKGKHKLQADDVKIFFYSVPKSCRFIGYVTIENPKGLKISEVGSHGLKIPLIGTLGDFDLESYLFKYLKKAAAVSGVKYISHIASWSAPKTVRKNGYDIQYWNDVINVFSYDRDTKKFSKHVRVSVKAYECGD